METRTPSASLILLFFSLRAECEKWTPTKYHLHYYGNKIIFHQCVFLDFCRQFRIPHTNFRLRQDAGGAISWNIRRFWAAWVLCWMSPHDLFPGAEGAPKELFEAMARLLWCSSLGVSPERWSLPMVFLWCCMVLPFGVAWFSSRFALLWLVSLGTPDLVYPSYFPHTSLIPRSHFRMGEYSHFSCCLYYYSINIRSYSPIILFFIDFT